MVIDVLKITNGLSSSYVQTVLVINIPMSQVPMDEMIIVPSLIRALKGIAKVYSSFLQYSKTRILEDRNLLFHEKNTYILKTNNMSSNMSTNAEVSDDNIDPKSKFGQRHVQILLLFTGVSIFYAQLCTMSVAVVAMTDTIEINPNIPHYDWDSQIKSYILSSPLWSFIVFQILSGYIVHKFNVHKLICYSVCMGSVINIFIPLSVAYLNWAGVVFCGVMMGFAQSFLSPSVQTFFILWVPIEERTKLGSFLFYAPSFGNIVGLPISGVIASSTIGWPGIFYVFGGLGILWSVLFYFFGVHSPSDHPKICADEKLYIEKGVTMQSFENKSIEIPWKSILTSGPVWTLIACYISQGCFNYVFMEKMPAYMRSVLDYDIEDSAFLSVSPYVAEFAFIFIYGWISNFALEKNVGIKLVRKVTNSIGFWGVASSLLILSFASQNESRITPILIIIVMFSLDAASLCGFAINHIDIAPNYAGKLYTFLLATEMLFGQFALLFCGYIISDETNVKEWDIVFYVIAGMYYVSNLIFVIFAKFIPEPWNDQVDTTVTELQSQ